MIVERVRGDDYRVQLVGRTKAFHANMLKKYWSREHEDRVHVSHAMVLEPEEADEDELSLFTSAQTETYKDVKVNEPQSRFARLWLDSQHDNLPKGIRTIKMCKLYSNDARW